MTHVTRTHAQQLREAENLKLKTQELWASFAFTLLASGCWLVLVLSSLFLSLVFRSPFGLRFDPSSFFAVRALRCAVLDGTVVGVIFRHRVPSLPSFQGECRVRHGVLNVFFNIS